MFDNNYSEIRKLKELKNIFDLISKNNLIFPIVFLLIVIVEGLVFSHIIPFGQVPDEITHYEYICQEMGSPEYAIEMRTALWDNGGFYSLPGNSDVKINKETYDSLKSVKFSKGLSFSDIRPNYRILRHLPAALGLYIGIALRLPMLSCSFLSEFFSLIFFAFMGFLVLKIVPIKKELFMLCLLLPMSIQQNVSISYDSVLNPCCFLLFAYILKLYYHEEKVGWKNLLVMLLLLIPIVVIKPPYAIIIFSILIIPFSKYELKIGNKIDVKKILRRIWPILLILLVLLIIIAGYVCRRNKYEKTIIADILCFGDFISLLGRNYETFAYYRMQQFFGCFGWIDCAVNSVFIIISIIVITYLNCNVIEEINVKLNVWRRILLFLTGLFLMLFIYIVMQAWTYDYLGYDMLAGVDTYKEYVKGLDFILGVQGRYLIPCLPLILVALSGETKRKNKRAYVLVQVGYYIFVAFIVFSLLYERYWG